VQLDSHVTDIARVIQLAVAPVFLLSGVGVTLTVLTNRLARIIDRARYLQGNPAEIRKEDNNAELTVLSRRAALIHRAITLSTTCALVVCLVIISLFLATFLGRDLADIIALLFILAMLAFVGALVNFLREIFLATHTLRFSPPPQ
jgi:Protein of unknown function (DUF2721)